MSGKTGKASLNDWLVAHPRQAFQLGFLLAISLWQFPVALFGFVIFLTLSRLLKLNWQIILSAGLVIAAIVLLSWEYEKSFAASIAGILAGGATSNWQFFQFLFTEGIGSAFAYLSQMAWLYLMAFPVLVAGILSLSELIPNSPYERALRGLQNAQATILPEIKDNHRLDRALAQLNEQDQDGVVLGVSKTTGKPVILPDHYVNQILLVLGTTGGGKTITLRRFYQRALIQRYPLIIVDGKPTEDNVQWVQALATRYGRPFYGFNCGDYAHYDCLAQGGYTELKDKIISLKDQWESDYYRSIAEDYLQTTFEVLLKSGQPFELKTVVQCLDYDELATLARATNNQALMNRVRRLENYERKDITGLQAHLNLLIHSELGSYFERNERTFSLVDVIQQQGVVYFALPALRFPSFSKVLGKLIINDIKAVVDRVSHPQLFTVFDEFSVFAGEQVLNLVNMGRGKGVHAVFGTQGLADLESVEPTFAKQVLNCVNTLICHRLNDKESAESVSEWVGTRDSFNLTAQISAEKTDSGMGSVRRNREFIIHPDAIKQELQPGEAFYITKVEKFHFDKVKVKYN